MSKITTNKKIDINKIKKTSKQYINKFKFNSKIYLKTNVLFASFVLSSLLNASLVRYFTVKNYFDIKPIIADLAVIIIIGAFGYFIRPKHQFKYYFVWSVIFTVLCIVNSMYFTNYLSFASFSLLSTSLQIVDVGDAVIQNVMEIKDFFYLWQIFAMIFIHHQLKKRKYYEKVTVIESGKVRAINTLVVGLILVGLFISTLNSVDISRLGKQWNREFVVMQFGLYTYQINDAILTLKSQISPLFGYDKNAKLFRDYYAAQDTTAKTNAYTDILKGKNVIVIHAESIQQFVLDTSFNGIPVAPNLKRLSEEGLAFTNFYAQESVGTSSDTEFTFNTSLMPTTNGTVFINYFDREYVTTEKLLKGKGYYTFSMHGNNGTFWNRNVVHKNLGYDRFFSYPKDFILDEKIGLGLSDASFFNQAIPKIKEISTNNSSFYGTLIMLSNHTPFTAASANSTYAVDYKYEKLNPITKVKETFSYPYMEGTKLGNYFKSVNYADQQIGAFIANLDQAGLLENTVIVIYGDHDAKLKKSEYEYYYNYDLTTGMVLNKNNPNYKVVDFYNYELNRKVPFIIWTKDNQLHRKVTKVMGMYDVMPTLGNMLGFSSKYALGHDMFSVTDNVVVFPNSNWVTDKMYYNSQKEAFLILKPGEVVSADYIEKYNQIANDDIQISDAIIVYDLIRKTNESEKLIQEYGG